MEWFKSWFDSSYYDLLYSHRDQREANLLLNKLHRFINPEKECSALDLGCGEGRHSRTLAELGYTVSGLDLSRNKIKSARKKGPESIEYFVGDMREALEGKSYDYIFNLFTSFGYFEDEKDDLAVLMAVRQMLKPGGLFVWDYINSNLPIETGTHLKEEGNIRITTQKELKDGHIFKNISVVDQGTEYQFIERIKCFKEKEARALFAKSGLNILHCFGDYALKPYEPDSSPRLIFIAT